MACFCINFVLITVCVFMFHDMLEPLFDDDDDDINKEIAFSSLI